MSKKIQITDCNPKLFAISGRVTHYQAEELQAYISKYGCKDTYGPMALKCVVTGNHNVYTFAFMAKEPTEKQKDYLERCTISVGFECDRVDQI